jgi:HEAT repeat protein
MLELLAGIGTVAAVLAVGVFASAVARRQRRVRTAIGEALGLTNVQAPRGKAYIEGEFEGFRVRVEAVSPTRSSSNEVPFDRTPTSWRGDRVTVLAADRIASEIELKAESTPTWPAVRRKRKDIEIGDERFDAEVFLRGPELLLRALLDAPTRALVRDFVARGGRVAQGQLRVESSSEETPPIALIRQTVTLARHLLPPDGLAARLSDVARRDPLPEVRTRALGALAGRFGDDEGVRAVCREALTSADAELRLTAALALGGEATDTLVELTQDTEGDNSQAARAIEALGRRLPLERALAILTDALRAGHRNVALAVIGALGRIGDPAAVSRLEAVLATAGGELSRAAVEALATMADGAAEAALIRALSHSELEVRVAAAEALGATGTMAAVAPLRLMLDSSGAGRQISRAARQAIAAIRARAPGASPGQVSLAEDETGQLSYAEPDRRGSLSFSGQADLGASPPQGSGRQPGKAPSRARREKA